MTTSTSSTSTSAASAPLRDPAGLVDRVPELASLAERVPSLRKAIEGGRPLDAYRALFWARRLGELADVARQLLAHRRLFVKPIKSAPSMMTMNGVGTSLYGRAEPDPNDGTYLATLFIVVVFIPAFPIATYLVRDASNGGRRAWSFLAKVPLGTFTYLWQRAIALGVLLLLVSGAAHAFEGFGHNSVYLVNGLAHEVTVDVSGAVAKVGAGQTSEVRTTVGKHAVVVRDGDRELESGTVDVPRGHGVVVWNVLGAAPVFVADVVYSSKGSVGDGPADPTVLCGESLVTRDEVDYVLSDPPKSLSTSSSSSGSIVKTHLGVAKGGLDLCLGYLSAHGKDLPAARLGMHVATATRAPADTLPDALEGLIDAVPMAEAEAFARDLLARDDSALAHRLYQNLLIASDQRARAITEYDARLAAHPSADAEYLALRVRTIADEVKTIDGIVARYPEHALLRRVQGFVHNRHGQFAEAAQAYAVLRTLDAAMWAEALDTHVESLVGEGMGKEALTMLAAITADTSKPIGERRHANLLAYRVAAVVGAPDPEILGEGAGEGDGAVFRLAVRAMAGRALSPAEIALVKDDETQAALGIARDAQASPDDALKRASRASPPVLSEVPQALRVLLAAEAARRGDDALAQKLGEGLPKHFAAAVTTYVKTGAMSEDLNELPLEMQAAIALARSRVSGLPAREKDATLERVKAGDVLRGPVTVAMKTWPS